MEETQDLELDADNHQRSMGGGPQAVRKAISLNLTKKTKMRAKSSTAKSKSRRDRRDRDVDMDTFDAKGFRRSKSSYDKKKDVADEDDREDEELDWSHTVLFIGEKVQDPMIHMCEKCSLPILIYGRLNPCKHVFCLSCAEKSHGNCARCDDRVDRIEPAGIGQIFVCSFGGSRNGVSGCRRSYLSQRDLIAHIKHRHEKEGSSIPEAELLRQQGALRMPFLTSGRGVMSVNLPTSTPAPPTAIAASPMVIAAAGLQPGTQQPIFVDATRIPLLQAGTQVQLQALPQAMTLTQTQYPGTTAFIPQAPQQQQQQFTGLQQGNQGSGQRPPPELHPNAPPPGNMGRMNQSQQQQQMNMHPPQHSSHQNEWCNTNTNPDWGASSNQGRSGGGQPPYYK